MKNIWNLPDLHPYFKFIKVITLQIKLRHVHSIIRQLFKISFNYPILLFLYIINPIDKTWRDNANNKNFFIVYLTKLK